MREEWEEPRGSGGIGKRRSLHAVLGFAGVVEEKEQKEGRLRGAMGAQRRRGVFMG